MAEVMVRGFAEILGLGMVTPVGVTAPSAAAAVRAGISRLQELPIRDMSFRPYRGAFIPESVLPPLQERPLGAALPPRQQRLLRLSVPALQEAARHCERPVPLLLGLSDEVQASSGPRLTEALAHASSVPVDLRRSRCFAGGRAAGLLALEQALHLLSSGQSSEVVVGGTDSLTDPEVLLRLEEEGRLPLRHGPYDALYPGEASAFLYLGVDGTAERKQKAVLAQLAGVGVGREPGHHYSQKPNLGEGLTHAFRALFDGLIPTPPPVRCVYAGFTGERSFAVEWGVAFLRARRHFAEQFHMDHPAENIGDVGAAQGPLMVGLAAQGLYKKYRQGPVLVWSSSDREERAAALVLAADLRG